MTTSNKQPNLFQTPGRVKTVKGSILTPENAGLRFILSVTNLAGKTEGNPMLPIFDKKWAKVKAEVRGWFATRTGDYKLGAVNTTAVQSDTWVVHMLCQNEDLEVSIPGLEKCLKEVCKQAKYERATVHVSTALTNSIPELTNLIQDQLISQGVAVSFYEEV